MVGSNFYIKNPFSTLSAPHLLSAEAAIVPISKVSGFEKPGKQQLPETH